MKEECMMKLTEEEIVLMRKAISCYRKMLSKKSIQFAKLGTLYKRLYGQRMVCDDPSCPRNE